MNACTRPSPATRQSGFTLIEVVITIAILMTLTVAVASMLRAGFDVRQGLSDKARTMHRLTTAIEKAADDLQHTFIVATKDGSRNGIDRKLKTIFKLEKVPGGGDKLSMTTMTHRPILAGSYESEETYVVYQLKESKVTPGRRDLYRAETPVIPLDLKEEVPTRLLATGIKSFDVECWTGDRWSKDPWDTTRGDTRNILPKLVRITFEAWERERHEGDGQDAALVDDATEKMSTVVYLNNASDYTELKEQDKSIKWGGL